MNRISFDIGEDSLRGHLKDIDGEEPKYTQNLYQSDYNTGERL